MLYSGINNSIYKIDTVAEFSSIPGQFAVAIVTDKNRGGVFVYDASQSAINDGGVIFNGWVRQYKGDSVSIKWFGAVDDGVTNCTSAINAALSAYDDVFVPPGTFLANQIGPFKSNNSLIGTGFGSILKQAAGISDGTALINMQYEGNASIANNIRNLALKDLQIRGYADSPVFVEHTHLMSVSAVSDLTIENVLFKGFKGDGLYIASNVHATEMHNERIVISKCVFDGVNKANRNAISVIDCDGVLIEDNYFVNVTASNMPGAIDIEPNSIFNNIQNVIIQNNRFNGIGGNAGCVGLFFKNIAYTNLLNKFVVKGNFFTGCNIAIEFMYNGPVHDGDPAHVWDVQILENNVDSCATPFNVFGLRGYKIDKNIFTNCTDSARIGYLNFYHNLDGLVSNNLFAQCGSVSGTGLGIFDVHRLKLINNTFDDCGTGVAALKR